MQKMQKNKPISVYCTEEERTNWQNAARQSNRALSNWIRVVANKAVKKGENNGMVRADISSHGHADKQERQDLHSLSENKG